MATLEKIRSKSVLLVIIIAVALLAFILGDAITNGRNLFGNNTTVAKVGKSKIEIQDYQRRHQELSQQLQEARQKGQAPNVDDQSLSQMALEGLIDEILVDEAVAALQIKSSPEALRYFMLENPQFVLPEMQKLLVSLNQSGIAVSTPADAYSVIFSPQKYGFSADQVEPYQRMWVALEEKYDNTIARNTYSMLLQNSFKANDLDIAAMKRDYVASAKLKVAKKEYDEATLKNIKVSDAEIQKAYEAQKEKYKIGETTKLVSFISVNVNPSNADMQASDKLAQKVMNELSTKHQVSKETRKEGLDIQNHDMRVNDIKDPALKNFLENAAIGTDSIVQRNMSGFMIARLKSRTTDVDSLELVTIQVAGPQSRVDAVLEYANSGASLDAIGEKFPKDSVVYNKGEKIARYTAQAGGVGKNLGLSEAKFDSLYNSGGRYIVLDQQGEMALIGTVTWKSSPTSIVQYETISYELHPSDATMMAARTKLEKFLTDNNTAKKFVANAAKSGYNPIDLTLTPSTPAVPMGGMGGQFYPDSRSVVRWVMMDAKDGEVSKIYQDKDPAHPTLYAVAVLDTYDEYLPWNSKNVKEELTQQIKREKAGDQMVKQYQAKGNLDAVAQAMGKEVKEVESLKFTRPDQTVSDPKVLGRIMGSKAGNGMKVVRGRDGVYAYVIEEITNETVQMPDEQFGQMFLQIHQVNPSLMLRGTKKIENNIYKFDQGE